MPTNWTVEARHGCQHDPAEQGRHDGQAREAAGEKDVKIGGGVATVRQYLEIAAIDEIHLAVSPVFLGRGENLLAGIDLAKMGFKVVEHTATERATHILLSKS